MANKIAHQAQTTIIKSKSCYSSDLKLVNVKDYILCYKNTLLTFNATS